MGLFDFFTTDIAIDLGTANTLIMYNDEVVVDQRRIGVAQHAVEPGIALDLAGCAHKVERP